VDLTEKITCRNCFARTPGYRRAPFCNAAQGRLLLLYEHFFMFLLQKFANYSRHIMKSATLLETENVINYYHSFKF